MNVFKCTHNGCDCVLDINDQRFQYPVLGAKLSLCQDCDHGSDDHKVEHTAFLEEWKFRIFPLIRRQDQQALRSTCKEYSQLKLGAKHREYYRPCDICDKRIRRRMKREEMTLKPSMGVKSGDQYVHVRCLPK